MIVREILQLVEIETNQIVGIENIRILDCKTTPIDNMIIIITIDAVIVLEKETTNITTDQEIILSHHIEIILNILTKLQKQYTKTSKAN